MIRYNYEKYNIINHVSISHYGDRATGTGCSEREKRKNGNDENLPPTTNIVHLADSAKNEDDSNKHRILFLYYYLWILIFMYF